MWIRWREALSRSTSARSCGRLGYSSARYTIAAMQHHSEHGLSRTRSAPLGRNDSNIGRCDRSVNKALLSSLRASPLETSFAHTWPADNHAPTS